LKVFKSWYEVKKIVKCAKSMGVDVCVTHARHHPLTKRKQRITLCVTSSRMHIKLSNKSSSRFSQAPNIVSTLDWLHWHVLLHQWKALVGYDALIDCHDTLKIDSKCVTTASHPSSTALSITCSHLSRWKMHSDWFQGVEIQGRWQHAEEMGYWYPSGLAKTICKWDTNVPLVMKGIICYATATVCRVTQ
jgi:hypothetical protein